MSFVHFPPDTNTGEEDLDLDVARSIYFYVSPTATTAKRISALYYLVRHALFSFNSRVAVQDFVSKTKALAAVAHDLSPDWLPPRIAFLNIFVEHDPDAWEYRDYSNHLLAKFKREYGNVTTVYPGLRASKVLDSLLELREARLDQLKLTIAYHCPDPISDTTPRGIFDPGFGNMCLETLTPVIAKTKRTAAERWGVDVEDEESFVVETISPDSVEFDPVDVAWRWMELTDDETTKLRLWTASPSMQLRDDEVYILQNNFSELIKCLENAKNDSFKSDGRRVARLLDRPFFKRCFEGIDFSSIRKREKQSKISQPELNELKVPIFLLERRTGR